MSIDVTDVVVGGVYATRSNQERRVTELNDGKVYYESRGGNVQNAWSPGHTKTSPPSLEKFVEDCDRIVSKPAAS